MSAFVKKMYIYSSSTKAIFYKKIILSRIEF